MRGSIMIMAALWLTIAVGSLCVLDVAHVWWQRRTLQGVVDMASLAGAQRLDDSCGGAQSIIKQSAIANGYTGAMTITCGRYDLNSRSLVANATPYNAVNVTLNNDVAYWFIPSFSSPTVSNANVVVQATSRVSNVGAFTLGTGLATVQSGNSILLNGLLTGLFGNNSKLNLNILSYQSLASTQIKLGDLAIALGAKDVTDLLTQPPPTMRALLNALSTITATTSSVASAAINALLPALSTKIASMPINLDGSGTAPGVFNIGLSNKNGALNASVNVLDAVLVAAQVANSGTDATPISLDIGNLTGSTLLSPLIQGGVSLRINEPPRLAIGEAGQDASGNWRTVANSAQIELLIDIKVQVPLVLTIDLPLYVSAAPGKAMLTRTQCGAGVADSGSYMSVQPGVAGLCLGGGASGIYAGTTAACGDPTPIISVLGSGIVLYAEADANVQPALKNIAFTGAGHMITSPNPVTVNSNDLGQDLNSAFTTLTTSLLKSLSISVLGLLVKVGPLLQPVVDLITPLITDTISPLLTAVVPPLLNLLGAQIGTSTVADQSLTCGNVQLVQ
jgi:uncharacterized membrane protein